MIDDRCEASTRERSIDDGSITINEGGRPPLLPHLRAVPRWRRPMEPRRNIAVRPPPPALPDAGQSGAGNAAVAEVAARRRRSSGWWRNPRARRVRRWLTPYLFIAPAAVFMLGFLLYPVVFNIETSFRDLTAGNLLDGSAPWVGFD